MIEAQIEKEYDDVKFKDAVGGEEHDVDDEMQEVDDESLRDFEHDDKDEGIGI